MTLKVESTSIADGQPIAETYRGGERRRRKAKRRWRGATSAHTSGGRGSPRERCPSRSLWSIPTCPPTAPGWASKGCRSATDEPRVEFAHWLVADIPPSVHELPEGAGGDGFVAQGKPPRSRRRSGAATGAGRLGTAGSSRATRTSRGPTVGGTARSRRGTTSASTTTRRRCTRSTSSSLGLEPGFTLGQFLAAIDDHVLERGRIVPTYSLNPDLR